METRDVPALQAWVCTDPPRKPRWRQGEPKQDHPLPWELAVQRYFHEAKPASPRGRERFLVGWHDDEPCALVRYRCEGQSDAFIQAVGVSVARQGGSCGLDAIENVLDAIRNDPRFDPGERVHVSGLVDPRNERSKRLLSRFEFSFEGDWGNHEEWTITLPAVE